MNGLLRQLTPLVTILMAITWMVAAKADESEPADVQAAEIDSLIEQITERGDHREQTEKLLKIGQPAVARLAKAAEVKDPGVVTRCFDVLGRLLVSEDQETAKAAQESLEKLSESEIDIVGRRARTTLRIKEVLRQREGLLQGAAQGRAANLTTVENGRKIQLRRAADGSFSGTIKETVDGKEQETPIAAASEKELEEKFPDAHKAYQKHQKAPANLGGAGIRINGQLIGGPGVQSIKFNMVNDKRHIEAVTGDEKVEITDTNGKDIELKHTRRVDGKSKTDEFKADDLDDLKKKHPDAAKLYEKYAAGPNPGFGGGIQMQIGGIGAPRPVQFPKPVPGFRPELNPTPSQTDGGARTIRAELDGRKIEITETDGTKIRIKLTKMVDDKEVTQEFSADDLKTLKAEHPEAAKLYEQLTGRTQ
ncbi:MAG: hypothetical protein JWP89_2922 [Schlesneria sp.]|nr:hypothetical protein [Schlesneria sp.]